MRERIDDFTLQQILRIFKESPEASNNASYEMSLFVAYDINKSLFQQGIEIFNKPTRVNIFAVALCLKGSCIIECDLRRYEVGPNTLFVGKPGSILKIIDNKIEQMSTLLFEHRLQEDLNISFQKLLPHYHEMERLTTIHLKEPDAKVMNSMFFNLVHIIRQDTSQLYYHEGVRAEISTVAYRLMNLFSEDLLRQGETPRASTRQEEYFHRFISLLRENFRQQRSVKFYAEKLHITPKYLSHLVTNFSGTRVSAWINQFVITEAKALLLNTHLTIQAISYELNFSNQAVFGKFFKQQTGMSPTEYRKSEQGKPGS